MVTRSERSHGGRESKTIEPGKGYREVELSPSSNDGNDLRSNGVVRDTLKSREGSGHLG